MTNMPLTHCHTCGRELPWNRIFVGDRAYCGAECLPVKTVDIQPDPRIAALEADLAEALELLEEYVRYDCYYDEKTDMLRPPERATRLLAKLGRFKILRDEDGDTEGEWVNG